MSYLQITKRHINSRASARNQLQQTESALGNVSRMGFSTGDGVLAQSVEGPEEQAPDGALGTNFQTSLQNGPQGQAESEELGGSCNPIAS